MDTLAVVKDRLQTTTQRARPASQTFPHGTKWANVEISAYFADDMQLREDLLDKQLLAFG